jgi:hypothetical protein
MHEATFEPHGLRLAGALAVLTGLLAAAMCAGAAAGGSAAITPSGKPGANLTPKVTWATAHDVSPPLRDLAAGRTAPDAEDPANEPDRGPISASDSGYSSDGAPQSALSPATIPSTQQNFEGLSNQDNFNIFGFRVNPPDPDGEVGPLNYVEMVNLAFAVYDKSGNRLLGPSTPARCGAGSPYPIAPSRQAIRSSSTTRSPTVGSCRSSPRAGSTIRASRSGTASPSRRPATRQEATTGTPSRRRTSSSSRTTRSTASGRTPTS